MILSQTRRQKNLIVRIIRSNQVRKQIIGPNVSFASSESSVFPLSESSNLLIVKLNNKLNKSI